MLTTIHVTVLALNGADRKRPLRVYDASKGIFGIVYKGECLAVTPVGPKTVKVTKGLAPKAEAGCRNAKLIDLGIEGAKPVPFTPKRQAATQAAAITPKLTPELAQQMIAMLQNYLAS